MNFKTLYKSPVTLMLCGICLGTTVNGQVVQLQPTPFTFEPMPKHSTIAITVTTAIANYHYNKVKIDDSLSTRIFDNYLSKLDKAHTVLLAADVKEFEKYRFQMDDALVSGDLSGAFKLFSVYATRMNERVEYALTTLKTAQNLSSTDVYDFSREDLPWFNTLKEEDQYWNKRIRYELISLKAVNNDEKKAYQALTRRYEKLKKGLETLKSENAFEVFMNAFTETVDPHSTYFSPKASTEFNMQMNKSLEGIGITFSFQDELPVIISVVKGGPVDKSGKIAVNDRILAIAQGENGEFEDAVGLTQDEVVQRTRGAKGSIVRLRILPAGAALVSKPKEVTIVRDKIVLEDQKVKSEVKSVKQGNSTKKIGIISIPNFYFDAAAFNKRDKDYASTTADVRKALKAFETQGVEGVMVDLRNNGGGSLREAVELTGLFINYGPVVQVRNANGKIQVESDKDSLVVYGGPVTILINRLSASASEIFSAALQDYGRALIIGEQSYGKGTVQTVYPVGQLTGQNDPSLGSLKFTMAKFYRVNGASTQHRGVTPDISFPSKYETLNIGESALKNVLPYDEIARANFTPVVGLKGVNELKQHHEQRMNASQEFKFLVEDIQKVKESSAKKSTVLDLNKFAVEQQKQQADELNRLNKRRKLQGLQPVAALGDQAKSTVDYVQDESLQITAELISKSAGRSASK
jgi:carboxyl-terminal processing protease